MVAPVLLDYEFQFSDNGVLLNATTPGPYVWDVLRVAGLEDIPDLAAITSEVDGQHGGAIHAAFVGPRFITFEGIFRILSGGSGLTTRFDAMKENLMNSAGTIKPLYVKFPGNSQRYLNAKFLSFRGDMDQARRLGSGPFQIQFGCEDPLLYIDEADQALTDGVNFDMTNNGTADAPFQVYFNGTLTAGTHRVRDMSNTREVSFALTQGSGDETILDMRKRRLTKNGVDVSGSLILREWFLNNKGVGTQNIRVDRNGAATITLKSRSAWW